MQLNDSRLKMLAPADVRRLAEAAGLPLADDDVEEITHRLNAFYEVLRPLTALPLETIEPWSTLPDIP